ncbi:sedoheptulose 7-phosphate cyclase [Rhodanobacter sp. AS-Z3]|uniref:sedoheptulose 7-phosphate cyclase n=1 Tax=Rhodanobacter sp. AS-Z3 TaxID=3031330 RepID=UPI002479C647|nr:sedoheptulose 7-phosphate cyclase [Rhodanobacter sp. AS-Z3]WEN15828.1 sedoheptulose 7-phosphate cyclase [Rhodanobacter sp. AS-Z3]
MSTLARWQVSHQRSISYDIIATSALLDPANSSLLAAGRVDGGRRFVVVDEQVAGYHGAALESYFAQHGIDARIVHFSGGEAAKTVDAYLQLVRELDDFPIHRRDEPIIAIGGGVLTDVVGFVAGSYRRGVPHIKVPTTLMGYVDAAVGIKTGINFNGRKNRLGSFEPPLQVLLDRSFLTTLPLRHMLNGMCEILKLAVIKDAALFAQLEHHGAASIANAFQDGDGGVMLDRSISGMLEELQPNLFEDVLARSVDFGHTFSYGLEAHYTEHLLHGEAVLLDIAVSVLIARQRGLLDAAACERVFTLIGTLGIVPLVELLDIDLMWNALLDRVEHRNGSQHVPLPDGIGRCVFVNDITAAELSSAITLLRDRTTRKNEPVLEC